eukprot:1723630-Lingulodinium_polyedra.AAC.1
MILQPQGSGPTRFPPVHGAHPWVLAGEAIGGVAPAAVLASQASRCASDGTASHRAICQAHAAPPHFPQGTERPP